MTWTASYINAGYLGSNYFKGIAYGNGVFVTAFTQRSEQNTHYRGERALALHVLSFHISHSLMNLSHKEC